MIKQRPATRSEAHTHWLTPVSTNLRSLDTTFKCNFVMLMVIPGTFPQLFQQLCYAMPIDYDS
jgi:hypothetical protein